MKDQDYRIIQSAYKNISHNRIILAGQVLSNQNIYRNRGRVTYMIHKAKKLKKEWVEQVAKQRGNKPMLDGELFVSVVYYHGDKRRRDVDNYCKLVFDCMEGIVFENDNQINPLLQSRDYDKDNPRVEVIINNKG